MWCTTTKWLILWLCTSDLVSFALQLRKQKSIQGTEDRSWEKSSRNVFSLLEVNYNFPSKPQGTGKCEGIAEMCKSSPKPEMNYPIELSSKFVDNACYDFQSVVLMFSLLL